MTLTVAARRPTLRINKARICRLAEMLHADSLPLARRNGIPAYDTITLVIAGDITIDAIHRSTLGIAGSTDVITLAYRDTPGLPPSAEIIVNAQLASRTGANRDGLDLIDGEAGVNWSPDHELALYIAHGFDHLAGNEDHTTRGFRSMRRRELIWVQEAAMRGLVTELIPNR